MASLQANPRFYYRVGAPCCSNRIFSFYLPFQVSFYREVRVFYSRNCHFRGRCGSYPICCSSKGNAAIANVSVQDERERPPLDINLAVVLAGFAFEAYTSPPGK